MIPQTTNIINLINKIEGLENCRNQFQDHIKEHCDRAQENNRPPKAPVLNRYCALIRDVEKIRQEKISLLKKIFSPLQGSENSIEDLAKIVALDDIETQEKIIRFIEKNQDTLLHP